MFVYLSIIDRAQFLTTNQTWVINLEIELGHLNHAGVIKETSFNLVTSISLNFVTFHVKIN